MLFIIFIWPVGVVLALLSPWNKKVKIAVAIIVAALGIFGTSFVRSCTSSYNSAASVSQSQSFYGVTYRANPSWSVENDSATDRTYTPDSNNVIYFETVDTTGYDVAGNIDELTDRMKSSISSAYTLKSDISVENTKLGNYNARKLSCKMVNSKNIELNRTDVIVFFNDYAVMITYAGATNTYSSFKPQFTSFYNSLGTTGDGKFATASKASSSTTTTTQTSPTSSPTSTSTSTSYETQAQTFKASLPDYCTVVSASDLGTTVPDNAKQSVFFYAYSDSSKATLVAYGTYFILDSNSSAKAAFDSSIQALQQNGAPSGTRVDGDDKTVWTCSWNSTYCHVLCTGNTYLMVAGPQDSMEYMQKLVSQLRCV